MDYDLPMNGESKGKVSFFLAPKAKAKSLGDKHRDPPFLDEHDVKFVAGKRVLGISDAAIANMMGCSIERIRRSAVGHEVEEDHKPVVSSWVNKIQPITRLERKARDQAAKDTTTWRPEKKS
jgi:hypothetical protein